MSDQKVKIMDLTTGTPVDTDYIPFIDISDTTQSAEGTTKKALKSDLKGDTGDNATVDAGNTTTLVPGSNATVTNSGTTSDAIFDFGIPAGSVIYSTVGIPDNGIGVNGDWAHDTSSNSYVYYKSGGSWSLVNSNKGTQGIQGIQGIQGETGNGIDNIALISTVGKVKTYRITYTDTTTFDYTVTDGADVDISTVVPYTGATGDVNLGANSLTADSIQLDTTPTLTSPSEGELKWNSDEGAVDIGMPGGNVVQSVGQELYIPKRCKNSTGVDMPNGYVVYINGASGTNTPTIIGADADTELTSATTIGMTTEPISNGQKGYVTTYGIVRDVNTLGMSVGSAVWLSSTTGGFTTTKPTAPAHSVSLGTIIRASATEGEIFVNVQNGYELDELHDVLISGKTTGDILSYNGTTWSNNTIIKDTKSYRGFIDNTNISITGNTDRTITLAHGTAIKYAWNGIETSLGTSWTSTAHGTDTSKVYFLYSTDGSTFAWSETVWSFDAVMVALAFYDTTLGVWIYVRELHGTYPIESHLINHLNIGTFRTSGGLPTSGTYALNTSTDVAITPGFDLATVQDEDLSTTIPAWTEGIYTTMEIGTSSVATFNTTRSFPFHYTTSGYININNPTTGLNTEGVTGKFYNVYQILIPVTLGANSQKFRTVFLQPQATFNSLVEAQAEDFRNINLGTLTSLSLEFVGYTRLTYRTSASYGTTGKVQLNGLSYLAGSKASQVSVGGFTPTSHSTLSNLTWTTSGHTGTPSKIPGFDSSGVANEIALSGLTYDGTTLTATGGTGLAWNATVAGTSGTGLGLTVSNSASAGAIGESIVAGNTQTNAVTLLSLDTGTSNLFGNKAISISHLRGFGGVTINSFGSATQAVGNQVSIYGGQNYNTNSTADSYVMTWKLEQNAGAGTNTGLSFDNYNTEVVLGPGTEGASFVSTQYGVGGTSIAVYGGDSISSSTNGLVNYTLSNTQSGATVMQKIDTGTSAQGHTGLVMNIYNNSSSATGLDVKFSTTGDGKAINVVSNSLAVNNKYALINFAAIGTLTSRSVYLELLQYYRQHSGATTITDNYNLVNYKRTSQNINTGGTFNASGSVLKLENEAIQTAGTLTDTVSVLTLAQGANTTGTLLTMTSDNSSSSAIDFATNLTTTTAPAGASTYINIKIAGVAYRILAQAVA